jgi:PAP_fibrillin
MVIGKTALLEAIAGKNRGLLANDLDKVAILAAIAQVEDRNPTPRPLEAAELLEGNWRLLYTTSQELLKIDQLPLLKLGQIYQCIRTRNARIYNVAEVYGLPFLEGLVSVAARFEAVSDRRVQVKFERLILGLQRLANYRSANEFVQQLEASQPLTALDISLNNREQSGWLDTTYLDQDMRIGRGNEGSVFVLTKVR